MNTARTGLIAGLTLLYGCWIALIANQHNTMVILLAFFGCMLVMYLLRPRTLISDRTPVLAIWGAISGYLSNVAAAGASECAMRGVVCIERDFTANLYFFPSISFGWVYGAILYASIGSGPTLRSGPGPRA